ncbi:hypothetical protein PVAP13_J042701 [Panicum virgatum]|nr:hypothetical protein PVAP13_J042701 [Panicum virgatum]
MVAALLRRRSMPCARKQSASPSWIVCWRPMRRGWPLCTCLNVARGGVGQAGATAGSRCPGEWSGLIQSGEGKVRTLSLPGVGGVIFFFTSVDPTAAPWRRPTQGARALSRPRRAQGALPPPSNSSSCLLHGGTTGPGHRLGFHSSYPRALLPLFIAGYLRERRTPGWCGSGHRAQARRAH